MPSRLVRCDAVVGPEPDHGWKGQVCCIAGHGWIMSVLQDSSAERWHGADGICDKQVALLLLPPHTTS